MIFLSAVDAEDNIKSSRTFPTERKIVIMLELLASSVKKKKE